MKRERGIGRKAILSDVKTAFRCSPALREFTIVNEGKLLGRPINIKKANKETKVYVGRRVILHMICVFFSHRLCMIYTIVMLLLVSCMSTHDTFSVFCQVLCRVNPLSNQQKHATFKQRRNRLLTISLNQLWLYHINELLWCCREKSPSRMQLSVVEGHLSCRLIPRLP